MRRLSALPLPLLLPAAGLLAATAALAAAGPAAAAPQAPGAAVSVRNCASTGGLSLPDGQSRYWCVGGVYTGMRLA